MPRRRRVPTRLYPTLPRQDAQDAARVIRVCVGIAAIAAFSLHIYASAALLMELLELTARDTERERAQVHILVLSSQKGGTGKTTLSGHLAVAAQNAGVGPVALIDTDPQGSLSHWWNARKAPEPSFVKLGPLELEKAL